MGRGTRRMGALGIVGPRGAVAPGHRPVNGAARPSGASPACAPGLTGRAPNRGLESAMAYVAFGTLPEDEGSWGKPG